MARREDDVKYLLAYRIGRTWRVFEANTHTQAKAVLRVVGSDREWYIAKVIETGGPVPSKSLSRGAL